MTFALHETEWQCEPFLLYKDVLIFSSRLSASQASLFASITPPTPRLQAGRTPLHFAAGEGHTLVVQALLRDPRVSTRDKDKVRARHVGNCVNRWEVIILHFLDCRLVERL